MVPMVPSRNLDAKRCRSFSFYKHRRVVLFCLLTFFITGLYTLRRLGLRNVTLDILLYIVNPIFKPFVGKSFAFLRTVGARSHVPHVFARPVSGQRSRCEIKRSLITACEWLGGLVGGGLLSTQHMYVYIYIYVYIERYDYLCLCVYIVKI